MLCCMGRRAPGMGDQHDELQHTQHIASSEEEEEEEEEEEDGGSDRGVRADPYPGSGEPQEQVENAGTPPIEDRGSAGHKPKKRCGVLCTVYCVESDLSGDIPPMYTGETRTMTEPLSLSSLPRINGELPLSPASLELELAPFLISSLGDGGHKVMMSCRVCLEDKSIKPLPCCKKGVCEECLKRYLSSQVMVSHLSTWDCIILFMYTKGLLHTCDKS